ncbi:MAG: ion transporter [Saprospiraceae bacterium]|nr:ion transporter [Saprospiraceae bacterium]HRD81379.1 ion transporter [Saprospiraceae bacterium]HRF38682.1 ion transporter [Saprospiraceae bacterium]HRJ15096.1 ion transporter [Saprospiraceae bacterium]HRK81749.1 ion transporter [Saprospiraceae bacterium]
MNQNSNRQALRDRLFTIIFEADTPAGKIFDVSLLVAILLSVLVVMLESVKTFPDEVHHLFVVLEWVFTIFFTIEYLLRLYTVGNRLKYAASFFGIIDLVSILPTYLSFILGGAQSLMVIRILRLLRVFRIFKLTGLMDHGNHIAGALKASRYKISIFLYVVVLVTFVFGSVMYFVEGGVNESFDSIPRSVYWCIVTITTVGYGDISPVTPLGQFLASVLMIIGYSIIAVPTGIITSEIMRKPPEKITTQVCPHCLSEGHDADAVYCKFCGGHLGNH